MRFQRLTRIRLQLVIYFCLHRGKFARKHCKLANLFPVPFVSQAAPPGGLGSATSSTASGWRHSHNSGRMWKKNSVSAVPFGGRGKLQGIAKGESVLGKIISAADLAALVGLSERHLRRLTKSGIVALAKNKAGRVLAGRYVLGPAILKLFERERAEKTTHDPNVALFKQARAEREICDAEIAKIALAAKRGEYLDRAMVEESDLRLVTVFRARCLAIPSAISHSLRGQTDFHTIYQIVETPFTARCTS
jgi:hypothetical protein